MKIKNIYFIIPCLILWSSCHKKETKNAAPPATSISVTVAKTADAVYYDKYQGTVVAFNTVELRSEVTGFITGIFFKEGDVVQKGTLLYEIDRRKYEAAYQQAVANLSSAQANLIKAQKDVDRYNFLLKNDAVAKQTVDQSNATFETSKSQVESARAGVASAKTDLSYSLIRAPFTGRIGISQVKLGAQVTPGTTLLNTISAEHPIAVDVVIPEDDINKFYKLQKNSTDSTFKLQLFDSTNYKQPGKIMAIDRGVANGTGTVKVRIEFNNRQDILKDGMSCVLNVLNTASGERVQIPSKAITEQMGEFFVFVKQDTVAKQHKVKLGPRVGTEVIILSGVKAGDSIITDGFQRLRDGGKVTLGNPAAAAPQNGKGGKGSKGAQ